MNAQTTRNPMITQGITKLIVKTVRRISIPESFMVNQVNHAIM